MTRSDYEAAIKIFLRELGPVVVSAPAEAFSHLDLRREVKEARRAFADTAASDASLIGIAAGLVEEFVTAEWERVIENGYSSYAIDRKAP